MTGVVLWDKKYGEWATHFFEKRGEYGEHLIVGHSTGIRRHGGVIHAEREAPYKPQDMKKPRPLRLSVKPKERK